MDIILAEELMTYYNYDRPHDALNGRSPADMLVVDLWETPEEFRHKTTTG